MCLKPWFLNAVIAVETGLSPRELLNRAKVVEHAMGRAAAGPTERWGPRVMDVDVLPYGDAEVRSNDLRVPHPELWNRRFVLAPLKDVLLPGVRRRRSGSQPNGERLG